VLRRMLTLHHLDIGALPLIGFVLELAEYFRIAAQQRASVAADQGSRRL